MELDLSKLNSILPQGIEVEGNRELVFSGLNSIYEAVEGEITWIKEGVKGEAELVNEANATGIICSRSTFELYNGELDKRLFMVTNEPKKAFVNLIKYIDGSNKMEVGIHPTAILHPDCKLGKNVSIGAYTIVGACSIGDNTQIYDHVKVGDDVTIGKECVIREFCSIGGAGFGFSKDETGLNRHIPHIGYTIIEDFVHIFPFCNVDKGNLGKTVVGRGTVMDHHVHVSHNCIVGENNIITAGVKFAGGAEVRNNSFLGVTTLVKEKAVIGSNCITGIGSVIIKDIPDNEIWVGNPAKFLKKNKEI